MTGRNLLQKDLKEEPWKWCRAGISLICWFESSDEDDFYLEY